MVETSAAFLREQAAHCRRIVDSLLNQKDPAVLSLLAMAEKFEAKANADD
jgi:hypothetical protein